MGVWLAKAIYTGTPAGRLLFHVLGAIGEFERDLIGERTRAGLAAARRQGARLGRPSVVDVRTRARIRRLRAARRSLRAIAVAVGVGKGTVARELGRES